MIQGCWQAPTLTSFKNWKQKVNLSMCMVTQTNHYAFTCRHQMQQFSKYMSSVRAAIEWIFGNVLNDFEFVDFKKNLKMGLSSVGKMYIVCGLAQKCNN